jgi:mannonate dehydratase
MEFLFSRRRMMQWVGGAAAALSQSFPAGAVAAAAAAPAASRTWPIEEGPDTPKLCLAPGDGGGPLPVTIPPPSTPSRMGMGGGGFGGFLAPGTEPAPQALPAEAESGRRADFMRNLPAAYQRIRQLGVTHLLGVYVGDWTEESIGNAMKIAKENGMVAYNSMINVPRNIIYGKPGRDKDIEKFIGQIQAAGKAGFPVAEYNFYAHRATEGYYETVGRANSGYTGFDFELEVLIDDSGRVVQPILRDASGQITAETMAAFPNAKKVKVKDLPPLADEGTHNLDEMWANISYFLKAVVPVAEKAGVRMALHPNDPPAPIARGSQQIMGTVAGWKHLISIVDSPANGITFDCGVTREMGEDPVQVADFFASRKRINHVHFRNVRVVKPYERYQEVFIDAGMGDMFGVMKALVRNKYNGTIYPEHPRALDYDRDRVPTGGRLPGYPGGGGYTGITFSVAYARAMMQAALESV